MDTSLVKDEDLLAEARRLTGLKGTTDVMRAALKALIERESARKLAQLGGSDPDLANSQRRRARAS
jgi:Arc/MetJ family transcription regulator